MNHPIVGFRMATVLLPIIWRAGLIPNLIGQSGGGKTASVSHFAKLLGLPEFTSRPEGHEGGAMVRFQSGSAAPEDFIGLYDPAALQGESPVTRTVPPEWVHLVSKNQSIILIDELDRARLAVLNAMTGGLAESPAQIGGVPIGNSKIVTTMNGETDSGTIELTEAFMQRLVHLYFVPNREDWVGYIGGVHPQYSSKIIAKMADVNVKRAVDWAPTDLASEGQRFERSADRLLSLVTSVRATAKSKDASGKYLLEDDDIDLALDALGVGQVGKPYWTDVRKYMKATVWLDRWGIDAEQVISDPKNATLPPDGLTVKAVEYIQLVSEYEVPFEYRDRLNDEDKEALSNTTLF